MPVKITFMQSSSILTHGKILNLTAPFEVDQVRCFDSVRDGKPVRRVVLQCKTKEQVAALKGYLEVGMLAAAIAEQVWDDETKAYKPFELAEMQFDRFHVEAV